jgi:hypothetical protein
MVLPGIQALFGFQLVAVFNRAFEELPDGEKTVHIGALLMTAVSALLVMAPAAYHRQVEPHQISRRFTNFASVCLTLAMMPLMIGTSLDIQVVLYVASGRATLASLVAAGMFAIYATLWYVVPRIHRVRRHRNEGKQGRVTDVLMGRDL